MGKPCRAWICVQGSRAVLLGMLGGKEISYSRQKKTAARSEGDNASFIYHGCLVLPGHRAIPVCPMSQMGQTGRHWLGEGELVERIAV